MHNLFIQFTRADGHEKSNTEKSHHIFFENQRLIPEGKSETCCFLCSKKQCKRRVASKLCRLGTSSNVTGQVSQFIDNSTYNRSRSSQLGTQLNHILISAIITAAEKAFHLSQIKGDQVMRSFAIRACLLLATVIAIGCGQTPPAANQAKNPTGSPTNANQATPTSQSSGDQSVPPASKENNSPAKATLLKTTLSAVHRAHRKDLPTNRICRTLIKSPTKSSPADYLKGITRFRNSLHSV